MGGLTKPPPFWIMLNLLSRYAFLLLLAVLINFVSGQALAQSSPAPPGLILTKETSAARFNKNFYVVPDPEKSLSVPVLSEKWISGELRPYLAKSAEISFTLKASNNWIVIPITNVSSSDVWELSFGNARSGRHAFLNKLTIYNSFSRKTVLESHPPGQALSSIPGRVQVSIPAGQTGIIVLELRNASGTLSTMQLGLKPSNAIKTYGSASTIILAAIPLLSSIILFSAFIMRRNPAYAAFGTAWLLAYLHFYLLDHYIFIGGVSAEMITSALWLAISLLIIAGFWLSKGGRSEFPPSLFTGIGFLCLICGLTSLLTADFIPHVGTLLGYAPPLISSLMILFLSWLMIRHNQDRPYFFLLFSALLLILHIGLITIASYYFSAEAMRVSYLFCISASVSSALFSILEESEDSQKLSPALSLVTPLPLNELSSAKETSEHRRLLQVLDQERAMMAEMQVQEARRTEEMRKAKETADEANSAKSAFLAVVSHEIRTPMTGIMGMVRLLLDTSLSRDQKEYASTIQDSGEALMALLNDILDFEKIESGKLDLEHVDFDLYRLLRGVQTLMNGHAASKGVELKLEVDPKIPQYAVGDPTRLRQVLLNLVNNAIKFTSQGTVYLRINDLTAEDRLAGNIHQIYFAVQDSGIGITPEVQKRLFMPFAQADSSTSRKYGGTGLGLAICKRLIEAMGGAISISSKPNEGSTFFFTLSLPVGHENVSKAIRVEIEKTPATLRQLRVLVVDDNGINQRVLTGLIEKDGHLVSTASTASEALDKHLAGNYDLILMDIELPDKNGIEATHEIRRLPDPAKASVPIVAMTGNTSDRDVAACFNAGMDDFLGKPITPEKLKAILAKSSGSGHFANLIQSELRQEVSPVSAPLESAPTTSSSFSFPDFDNEDEDTFATAIREFEELEKQADTLVPEMKTNLDFMLLGSLKNSLSATQMEDLLISFYEKAEELITAVGEAWLSHDIENLAHRAHELKGMAGNFGFKAIFELSAKIESAAKAGNEPELKRPVEQLAETYALSKASLQNWLKT